MRDKVYSEGGKRGVRVYVCVLFFFFFFFFLGGGGRETERPAEDRQNRLTLKTNREIDRQADIDRQNKA